MQRNTSNIQQNEQKLLVQAVHFILATPRLLSEEAGAGHWPALLGALGEVDSVTSTSCACARQSCPSRWGKTWCCVVQPMSTSLKKSNFA